MNMLTLLWLIPTLPLIGSLLLALSGGRLPKTAVAVIGAGSVGLAALVTVLIGIDFIVAPPPGNVYVQSLWTWIDVAGFTPPIGFHLDALSLVMTLVVTVVGFLIHLYSAEFMGEEEGYNRYFAYMNLFVAAMCTLVLADNLLFLYLGWEGVGLCSYLLIGFWYRDPANGLAARKAFVVTRVGDTAMIIGLFLLFNHLGTLNIQELMQRAAQEWPAGSTLAVAAAALLLGGALGKSAQLPLQVWLPDAMAGPTPVSALIHAATMVTAGVYLIARTHVLFSLAPIVQSTVAVIGALTLLLAAFSALAQHDIKRVLAYSTISQIGYMFLALGIGAWSAAIFHFMTHAFFKALLFMSAGVVILSLHHEHNIFRMGDLRRRLPVAFWTFLIGGASLAALPIVTAGFYSKDLILLDAWSSPRGGPVLWVAGWVGAWLTGIYIFRVVFIAFFGEAKTAVGRRPGYAMQIPLVILAALSVAGGWVELPPGLGNMTLFSSFLHSALPAPEAVHPVGNTELILQLLAGVAAVVGIYLAYLLFLRNPHSVAQLMRAPLAQTVHRLWYNGWGFDWLYDRLLVRPFLWAARVNRDDFIDAFYRGIAWVSAWLYDLLSATQTGVARRYAGAVALGAVILIAITVLS